MAGVVRTSRGVEVEEWNSRAAEVAAAAVDAVSYTCDRPAAISSVDLAGKWSRVVRLDRCRPKTHVWDHSRNVLIERQ